MVVQGYGGLDFSSVYKFLSESKKLWRSTFRASRFGYPHDSWKLRWKSPGPGPSPRSRCQVKGTGGYFWRADFTISKIYAVLFIDNA
jgi:hypothetical protein